MAALTPIEADLSERTCLVTGANTGIGKEIARGLANLGARVVLACRSEERGRAALAELTADTGNDRLELELVDLSQPASIRAFCERFTSAHERLDVLVNNAGIWTTKRKENVEGLELTFATNVLGYFRLTNGLDALLRASAPARIVNVASKLARNLDLDDLNWTERRFHGEQAYAASKQANRMLAWARAARLSGTTVTINVMHPGPVKTEIARDATGLYGLGARAFFGLFGRTPPEGADTAVWLAAAPELEGVSGKFWQDRKEQRRKYHDPAAEQALWDRCLALSSPEPHGEEA